MGEIDVGVRTAAFQWLSEQTSLLGEDVLPYTLLLEGFQFRGERVPRDLRGIFKPRIMELPLSIKTIPDSPYDDGFDTSGILHYHYREDDPQHRDNIGLREIMRRNKRLVYFYRLVESQYMVVWSVYIVGENPANLMFQVQVDEKNQMVQQPAPFLHTIAEDARRQYQTAQVRVRLHQRSFRERVLLAYQSQCALCHLRHRELLDAAHIIPDPNPEGWPMVRNGLALCKLHHAAYDSYLLTITPDYLVRIREDILHEEDGPVLEHALKGLDHNRILLPRHQEDWPNQEALEWRFARFQSMLS
jgi:putative restriction endonuclease